jgi:hypothetical protein
MLFCYRCINDAAGKGKQMMPGPIKEKVTGLQDGYFTDKFPRVFENAMKLNL